MSEPVRIFITYSHSDMDAKEKLIKALAVMKRNGLIDIRHDRILLGGDEWEDEIFNNLVPNSDLLLYLVSTESMASENCYKEFEIAMGHTIRIIPIILEDCDWKRDIISDFNAYPDGGKPINEWVPESKGWQNAVQGIRKTVEKMREAIVSTSDATRAEFEVELAFQKGNFMYMFSKFDSAIEAYSHAIELDPLCYKAHVNRGNAFGKLDKLDEAIAEYGDAIRIKSDYADAYCNRALAYKRKGNLEKAIADFNEAIRINPDDSVFYNNRGNAFADNGLLEEALSDYNIAIEYNPDYADAYNNRGNLYTRMGQFDMAIQDFNKSINLNPYHAIAYTNRGCIHMKKENYDEAMSDFNLAIKLDPDIASFYYHRGRLFFIERKFDKAMSDFNMAINFSPNASDNYMVRALIWMEKQNWEKTKDDLEAAKRLGVDIATYFQKGIVARYEQGKRVSMPDDIAEMLGGRSE